ncbi:OmpA family protein [Magnetospirillum aberrantis]|uniref:OmpA family protein n=1 Tax=Magnetospirillum aberrantis SpK TaxID=908842 RepID=A0A7C9QTI8_9PROT|nr:OmpA family protein [Magnetospirillum aberrantis]NFV80303.1 OmpA family protein [Magnetospirillum aberrantis SpK]
MKRSSWRVLAYGAVMTAVALPASAQVVIGGNSRPSVEVNWSVLDSLGHQPTLADMLKADGVAPSQPQVAPRSSASQGVQYRPYKAGAQPYAKTPKTVKSAKAAPKPAKKSSVVPASASADSMADLVQSSQEAKPAAQPPAKPQMSEPAVTGPQVSLPELPKAAPVVEAKAEVPKVEASKVAAPKAEPPKVELAKVEAPKIEIPKVEAPKVELPKAEVAALPPMALTPPPLPAAKTEVVAAVEQKAQEVAALPPAAPVSAPSAFRGDTLTVPFSVESARLSDASRGELDLLAKRMLKDEGLGLQLMAYADGDDASASKARRLSLSRALEVRKYLMDKGLRSTRIEVRALGNKFEGSGSPDRVDAVLVNR